MKLALFNDYRPGLVIEDRIIDLVPVVGDEIMREQPRDRLPWLIENYAQLRSPIEAAATQPGVSLSDVRLRAPLPRPNKMLFGLGNYKEFIESPHKPFNAFIKSPRAVVDPDTVVPLIPFDAIIFQHEGELGIVIGKGGSNIPAEDALDHVFGYVALVDVSARGLGGAVNFINKSPDNFCPLGPWIATSDAVGDPQSLRVRVWVNGELRQDYNTSDMENPVREIVAFASRVLPLKPGDVLACGVNHQGLGPLQDGERCEIEIEKIGRFGFEISDPQQRRWPVGVDKKLAKAALAYRRGEHVPAGEMYTQRIS